MIDPISFLVIALSVSMTFHLTAGYICLRYVKTQLRHKQPRVIETPRRNYSTETFRHPTDQLPEL